MFHYYLIIATMRQTRLISFCLVVFKNKAILQRQLPDYLKLTIAKQIENNLFAKAGLQS